MIDKLPAYISLIFEMTTLVPLLLFIWTIRHSNSETTKKSNTHFYWFNNLVGHSSCFDAEKQARQAFCFLRARAYKADTQNPTLQKSIGANSQSIHLAILFIRISLLEKAVRSPKKMLPSFKGSIFIKKRII